MGEVRSQTARPASYERCLKVGIIKTGNLKLPVMRLILDDVRADTFPRIAGWALPEEGF